MSDATAWLHARRLGGGPAAGRPSGVSAASWHALASLHKVGSGGSGGSTTGTDNGMKAASAPAILVRACNTLGCTLACQLSYSVHVGCHCWLTAVGCGNVRLACKCEGIPCTTELVSVQRPCMPSGECVPLAAAIAKICATAGWRTADSAQQRV